MVELRRYDTAELELMKALSVVSRKGDTHKGGPCPSASELRIFSAGKCMDTQLRDEILAHLSSCDRCILLLVQMRERPAFKQKMSFALVAAAVLLIVVWIGFHRAYRVPDGVATIDLRAVSHTRGLEDSHGAMTKVHRSRGQARIILPIGSEGKYDCEVLPLEQDVPINHVSGETSIEDHNIVLNLPLNLSRLKPGRYLLVLRHNDSDWVYYPFTLE